MQPVDSLDPLVKLARAGESISALLQCPQAEARALGASMLADLRIVYDATVGSSLKVERSILLEKARVQGKEAMKQIGPILWKELHTRALTWQGEDDAEWLNLFGKRLPCGECKREFRGILAKLPPRWGEYFAWTVDVHNAVNEKLGKPVITVDNARKLWS